MTTIEDRPDLAERYSSAIDAKDLTMITEARRPVDMLVAAGWVQGDTLGTTLYRLLREFDRLRADVHRAAQQDKDASDRRARLLVAARKQAKAQRREVSAVLADDDRAALVLEIQQAHDAAWTERLLILSRLRSLPDARRAMAGFASVLATRASFMAPDTNPDGTPGPVMVIAGRALAHWLDPLCPMCDGRGFNGGYREPQVICTSCNGTRTRRLVLWDTQEGEAFGRRLMAEMDRKATAVHALMSRYLDTRGEVSTASHYLHDIMAMASSQLAALNSAQAQED